MKGFLAFMLVLALAVGGLFFWITDRTDDRNQACADRGGTMVRASGDDMWICVKVERIPLP